MTLREAVVDAANQLRTHPNLRDNAQQDATVLLLHLLGISRASLIANDTRVLTPAEQSAYQQYLARRLATEPVQYITGEQEFYALPFRVTSAVLIPRPETEHLVEAVLAELDPSASIRVLDVGTGSGAIAIALAVHLPHANLTALDISPAALEVANANAKLNNVADRIRFLHSDLLAAVAGESGFDAIVSNPPYIPTSDHDTLHPQVRDHEPALALFAGPAGLDIYRSLIPQARAALAPNGLLALEIGFGQRDAIAALLAEWNAVQFVEDLQQIPRVAIARKP